MDKLKTIIQLLTKEETKEFRTFINRQKQKKNRLDLVLFDLLVEDKEYKPEGILKHLYGNKPNKQAYHALRKRLTRHLLDFIVLKRMDEDTTTSSSVMGMLSLSRYLFDKRSWKLAWHYLKKAEKLAESSELFPLLNNIFLVQMENQHPEFGDDLDLIISRWENNKKRLAEEENAVVALSLIRKMLATQRIEGINQDLETNIPAILGQYNLSDAIFNRPKLLQAILSITRSAYLGRKDFKHFGPYAEKFYRILRQKKVFTKANREYQLNLLYMICHAHYRVLNYRLAQTYLQEFLEVIEESKTIGYSVFYPKYVAILSAIWFTTGENEKAIEVTRSLLGEENKKKYLSTKDFFNHSLNLSVYYFAAKKYEESLDIFIHFGHSDKWIEKKMGKEWMFRKSLIELINYVELEYIDLTENRIRSIERQFKGLFEQEMAYKRGKMFIKFIKKYTKEPNWFNPENFEKEIIPNLQVVSGRREDIQMMGFYSWLKGKSFAKAWYPTFLEVIDNTERLSEN